MKRVPRASESTECLAGPFRERETQLRRDAERDRPSVMRAHRHDVVQKYISPYARKLGAECALTAFGITGKHEKPVAQLDGAGVQMHQRFVLGGMRHNQIGEEGTDDIGLIAIDLGPVGPFRGNRIAVFGPAESDRGRERNGFGT